MTELEKIKLKIKKLSWFTLPRLQMDTGKSYIEVRRLLEEFIKSGTVSFDGRNTYRFVPPKMDNPEEYWFYLSPEEKLGVIKKRREDFARKVELSGADGDMDEKAVEALMLCINRNDVSASMLQRTMSLGYARSNAIINWMENMGYVSKAVGSARRKILVSRDEIALSYSGAYKPVIKSLAEIEDDLDDMYSEDPFEGLEEFSVRPEDLFDEEDGNEEDNEEVKDEDKDEDTGSISDLFREFFGNDGNDDDDDDDDGDNGDNGELGIRIRNLREREILRKRPPTGVNRQLEQKEKPAEESGRTDFFQKFIERQKQLREEKKCVVSRLTSVLKSVAEVKSGSVPMDKFPSHSLWTSMSEFCSEVNKRLNKLILSDSKMTRTGAIKKAETYLEAVRDTHDGKMMQVYERMVFDLKTLSNYKYNQIKKQLLGG